MPSAARITTMPDPRNRVDLRGDPVWIKRIQAQAKRLGLSLTGYIKQAVTRQLEKDEAEAPSPPPPPPQAKGKRRRPSDN
jgi:hypothetical protein